MSYDCFTRCPRWVKSDGKHEIQRPVESLRIDRQVESRWQVSAYDYSFDSRYRPLSLGYRDLFSSTIPATSEVFARVSSLLAQCHEVDCELLSGPLWRTGRKWLRLREDDDAGPVIPHAVWVSVVLWYANGRIRCWSFEFANIANPAAVEASTVSTAGLESRLGFPLWPDILDDEFQKQKARAHTVWW